TAQRLAVVQTLGETRELALRLGADERAVLVDDRDARAVIASILEPAERVENDRNAIFRADVADDAAHTSNPTPRLLDALARAMIRDFALGDLIERDRDRLVGVDRFLVDEGLACEVLSPVGRRLLLHADPVIQLTGALRDDVDEAEFGIGMREQLLQVAENG